MINAEVFSPCERIGTLLGLRGKEMKASYVQIVFDDDPEFPCLYDCNLKYDNQQFPSFGANKNRDYLRKQQFSGKAVFLDVKRQEIIAHRFTVYNVLRCSNPLVKEYSYKQWKNKTNSRVGSLVLAAPEARDSIDGFDLTKFEPQEPVEVRGSRPFYQYKLLGFDEADNSYIILGPSCVVTESVAYGWETVDDVRYEISLDPWFAGRIQKVEPKEEKVEKDLEFYTFDDIFPIIMYSGTSEWRYNFGQSVKLPNATKFAIDSMWLLLNYVVYLEVQIGLDRTNSELPYFNGLQLRIPMEVRKGTSYLPDDLRTFIEEEVLDHSYVREALADFDYSTNGLILTRKTYDENGKLKNIRSNLISADGGTAACFSWALAAFYGIQGGYTGLFNSMNDLYKSGFLQSQENGVTFQLVGNTSKYSGVTKKFNSSVWGNVNLARKDFPKTAQDDFLNNVSDGYFLFGYDPKEKNSAKDEPDHWILAYKKGKDLFAVYDPYQVDSFLKARSSINHLLNKRDALILTFSDGANPGGSKWAFPL